jgi:2'-hydroxyisoflavone reductase
MDVLVLGGTHHVGRSVVEAALERGDRVTTVTRGLSGPPPSGASPLYADRLHPSELASALGSRSWDSVIDTWSGAPRAVEDAATLLCARVGHYSYVSSRSVYTWPIPVGLDETGPVVDADAASTDPVGYAAAKRGGELAAVAAFGDHALVARAGLILGPYERVGRLPWWLRRMQRGGRVLCPGPKELPLQYIDGRDLAKWLLAAGERQLGGVYNTVSEPGHTTMGDLLQAARAITGDRADLVWVPSDVILAAGIAPWTELPVWVPPDSDMIGLHTGNVAASYAQGLRCRPAGETVADTWAWLTTDGDPASLSDGSVGLDPDREGALLRSIK